VFGDPVEKGKRIPREYRPRKVTIESGFWIFDTPCTQALWVAVMGEGTNPSYFTGDAWPESAERPVDRVSWEACQEFVGRLNERLHGLVLNLPSEAQWEYACRAGSTVPRYRTNLDSIAWYSKNSGEQTHPVARLEPNDWGLYDTLGNVWEWCADEWHVKGAGGGELAPPEVSALRVIRGGSWRNNTLVVRASHRGTVRPSLRDGTLGFRCAEFRSGS